MRTITFFCALFFLLLSCTSNQAILESEKQLLTAPDKPSETGYFKNHFELAEIIQIQTSDDFLISDIKKLIRHKDNVILFSGTNNTVFIINAKNGNIETRINKIGTGPGESKTIIDISFDESSEQLLIYNDYYKLLFFDIQGKFLSEIKVDGTYEGISWYDGEVFFHNKLQGYSCYPYLVKILRLKTNTWREIGHDRRVDFPIRTLGRQMVKSKQLWFTAPLDFNLFHFNKNQVQIPYELSLSNTVTDERLIKESTSNPQRFFEEVTGNNLIYAVNSIRETTDHLVFRSNQGGIFIINKNENKIYWDSYVEETLLGMDLTYYYPHDGDDDKIMFILPAEVYTQHMQSNPKSSATPLKIKEDDNPILIFYKQKNIQSDNGS
ncbi:6-bladed beta-propeller [Parapedobacter koreensis]|uniref:6-bladed beta-propeller protein n=1 Tax=Parapedobacter koreensis TaxID=332977 RepID=A0A1H7F231_9SPHI|nr:6-bladed beta-propeller [Parapedobacter koreensis]SEK19884.1 6-bladed beta-propeller protein [Parapedobacter koreensis]